MSETSNQSPPRFVFSTDVYILRIHELEKQNAALLAACNAALKHIRFAVMIVDGERYPKVTDDLIKQLEAAIDTAEGNKT